jgi:hypothetical protein
VKPGGKIHFYLKLHVSGSPALIFVTDDSFAGTTASVFRSKMPVDDFCPLYMEALSRLFLVLIID